MFSRFSIALLFLTALSSPTRSQEFQSWSEGDITESRRRVDFIVPFVARIQPDSSSHLFTATGFTVDYRLPRCITATAGYLYVDLPGVPVHVNAPLMAVSESLRLKRLTISDRNRFEKLIGLGQFGDHVGLGASPWRYRNRAFFDLPLATSSWHAFADGEAFYDFAASGWNEVRFRAGAGRRLSRRLFLDVYFVQQNTTKPSGEIQAVGSTLRVELSPHK